MDLFIQAQTSHPGQRPRERSLNARFPDLCYALFIHEKPDLIQFFFGEPKPYPKIFKNLPRLLLNKSGTLPKLDLPNKRENSNESLYEYPILRREDFTVLTSQYHFAQRPHRPRVISIWGEGFSLISKMPCLCISMF